MYQWGNVFRGLVVAAALGTVIGCGGGGSSSGGGTLPQTSLPPVATLQGWAPNDASLQQYRAYTFTATATDPNIGGGISEFDWDFGDGTRKVTPSVVVSGIPTGSCTYAYVTSGTPTLTVTAKNSAGLASSPVTRVLSVVAAPSPLAAVFTSPAAATTVNPSIGSAVTVTFTVNVTNTGTGTIAPSGVVLVSGDTGSTQATPVDMGGGNWNIAVTYPAASTVGQRQVTPTVTVTDSGGISSPVATGPVITINSVSATNSAPVITLITPATDNTVAWTSKPFDFGFTLTDAENDPIAYTVDWGDGSPAVTGTTTGPTAAGASVALTHKYADGFTATTKGVSITVTATDNRSTNSTATPKARLVNVTFNTLPTATILSPQASGTAPTGLQAGITPPYVVIPLNGKLTFTGSSTLPGSQDAVTTSWSFPGGGPSVATGDNPGNVIFAGSPGAITAETVTYTVTDAFGRTATATKQVLVDGINTQQFNLSFQYRLKSDNNTNTSLTPVATAANGLGASIQIFQDGLSNTYNVQNQAQLSGAKAVVNIPVRSDLPFYVEIPGFGNDATTYLMRIPNAPSGAYADPTLTASAPVGSSTFSFQNATAPWNPSLQIVTAQGFAPESLTAPQRKLNGYTDIVLGTTPANQRWLDRLSVPANDPTGAIQWSQASNAVGQLSGVPAYQLFAEWPTLLLTRKSGDLGDGDPTGSPGVSSDLGFVLDYAKYSGDTQPSETFTAFSMQAFRVPAGVTDPYQLSPAWQSIDAQMKSTALDVHEALNPVPLNGSVPAFFDNLVYGAPGSTPLAGGIASLPLPYDPNDPDRVPLMAPTTRSYSNIRKVFSYSEYLWSTVWARPLVLNTARPKFIAPISTFPYFRYSKPSSWPKASGISPDNSAFDLTVRGGGVFDGSAPVGLAGAAASATGVGRFFWTAFTPSYGGDANSGAAIARTWLADDATQQPPTSFPAASATGDATDALGFMTPQDTIVDKRGRNADGSLNGSLLGGYRVTWYNPTQDASLNPVPPDFWVVELKDASGTKHFMLPGSYPSGTQSVNSLILTDARTYLPSGNAPSAGPVPPVPPATQTTDRVAPGYCWFDVPVELRPASGATLTVFAVKSILKNHPVAAARPLNRPDWMDAIKTATATMKMLTSSGVDLTYAYKIPFNFDWDIVVASGPQTPVAP
ncbi:hypothetical protein GETHPA_10960 [Geothrix rubra]|uniref:PKD domain-containing protein n=1 Tax=Geothrix rubra TaxID=2927977 RepID=A0ABQ5Q4D9_9BACT|nr:hypothetical protein GETHPA_10960 [Geothrix rubra]